MIKRLASIAEWMYFNLFFIKIKGWFYWNILGKLRVRADEWHPDTKYK